MLKLIAIMTKDKTKTQAGVTLMLAVLILAAITAVAFSMVTIVLVEIKTSGDELRTEPALYATLGVTEEALFQYKRFINTGFSVVDCTPSSRHICDINNVTMSFPGDQPIEYDDSPKIQPVSNRSTITLPMYLATDFDQQYSSVKVEMIPIGSTAQLYVKLVKTDIDNTVTDPVAEAYITEGGIPFQYNSFASTGQYDLVLDNDANSSDVAVSITTTRFNKPEPTDPDGLPFVGEQVLRIMANYLGLSRTYQVRIPIP